ncbi:MAG: DHA2 family efflux MFS transporter permease subunit, partial [Thermomicrobiales bacterium]
MSVFHKSPCDAGVIFGASSPAGAAGAGGGQWVLVAAVLGSSMVFIDSSVVNVALPTIQEDLGATAAATQWIVESYALLLAALVLVGGALGDRLGRRRVFVIGTVLFTLASIWCALANTPGMLITARAAQGVAGALLTPTSLALISASFHDETERGKAIGTWSGFTAITAAIGPVLGGWLVDTASWRWIFIINVPLGIAILAVALTRVPESRDPAVQKIDWWGALLTTVGLGGLVFGLIEAPVAGWTDPLVMASLVVGALSLIAFVVVESRIAAPMMPLGLFRSRTFSGTNLLTFFLYAALGGALYFFPFLLIQVQGYGSTAAGAALLPFGDPLLAHHRLDVERATAWGVLPTLPHYALRVALPVLRVALGTPAGRLARAASDRLAADPHDQQLGAARFTIRVEATSRDGHSGSVELCGHDPYGLTARALALRAHGLAHDAALISGARTPAEGLDARAVLARLRVR